MPTPIETEVLKALPLFKALTAPELENLASYLFEKSFHPGSTLFVEGMAGEILYLIRKGRVEILKRAPGGEDKVLATLKGGDSLGEMSLVDNLPRTATARVAEESVLLVMTKKSFNTMLEKHPAMGVKILLEFLRIANDRLRKANETLKQV